MCNPMMTQHVELLSIHQIGDRRGGEVFIYRSDPFSRAGSPRVKQGEGEYRQRL